MLEKNILYALMSNLLDAIETLIHVDGFKLWEPFIRLSREFQMQYDIWILAWMKLFLFTYVTVQGGILSFKGFSF